MKKFLIYSSCFLFFWILCGCGMMEKQIGIQSFPKKTIAKKTSKQDQTTWKQIQKQKTKSFEQKIKNIEMFIKANKGKEIAIKAYFLKAKLYSQKKKHKEACLTYHKVVESSFSYAKQWPAYRASAQCYFKNRRTDKAFEVLESFIQNPKETSQNKKASAQLQWKFLKNKETFRKRKLLSLSHLYLLSSRLSEKQFWKDKGTALIRALPDKELVSYAQQAYGFAVFEGYLLYEAGEYFWKNKKLSTAKTFFRKSLSSSLPVNLKKLAEEKLSLIQTISKVNPYLIGVLVPLSGRRKALGEKVLRGLYIGLGLDKGSAWQIVVMDSKSHPDVVRAQLENLFYKHHVIAVVGGLTGETAKVIADRTEAFAIPTVLFSQKKDITLNRKFVFQNSITAEQILEPLVKQVTKKLKIKTASILYPNDLYGKEYASLFSDMFKKLGGEIKEYEMYKTGEVDFKKHIKNLLHLNIKDREEEFEKLKADFLKKNSYLSERSQKLTPENLLPIKKEFSALFIPDSFDQVKKIKDHLKYFGVKDTLLLGTDLWREHQISSSSEDLSFVFVNLSKKDKSLIQKSFFYKEFIQSYGQAPGLFEQRAYNSAVFLKKALEQGVKSRLSLQKELQKIKKFEGAYYKVSVSKDRIFNYPLSVYKADLNQVRTLDSVPVK